MALVADASAFSRSLSSISSGVNDCYFNENLYLLDNFTLFKETADESEGRVQEPADTPDNDAPGIGLVLDQTFSDIETPKELDSRPTAANINGVHSCNTEEPARVTTSSKDLQPPAVRPKIFSNTARSGRKKTAKKPRACASGAAEAQNGKEKRREKKREKSRKKWKPVYMGDLGFHISLLPPPPSWEAVSFEDEDCCDADDESEPAPVCNCQGACFHGNLEAFSEKDAKTKKRFDNVNHRSHYKEEVQYDDDEKVAAPSVFDPLHEIPICGQDEDVGDIQYFLNLGIDVTAYDYDNDSDDVLFWDGVSFAEKEEDTRAFSRCLTKPVKNKTITTKTPILGKSSMSKPKQSLSRSLSEEVIPRFSTHVSTKVKSHEKRFLLELECGSKKRIYVRRDRHRRVQKVHKAVKSKNCRSIFNNAGRKAIFMHHRLIKKHDLCLEFRSSPKTAGRPPPMPKVSIDPSVAKNIFKANRPAPASRGAAPAQNLKHALHETNTPSIFQQDLASFLISLQHRELTPEDYDMLLRLDDSVKPKTVCKNVLDNLKTEIIGPDGAPDSEDGMPAMCTVCMEPYMVGQKRKFLPCKHDFHAECIDTWLENSSMKCPLDGLPIES